MNTPSFNDLLPEEYVKTIIREVKNGKRKKELLVQLLPVSHPLYTGRGTTQVNHLRGFILASFEQLGLPENAIIYALEELENSLSPYLVAGAAKAIRGGNNIPSGLTTCLQKAMFNIAYADEIVDFEKYEFDPNSTSATTALEEILYTFQWLQVHGKDSLLFLKDVASTSLFPISNTILQLVNETIHIIENGKEIPVKKCCSVQEPVSSGDTSIKANAIKKIPLEDQEGNHLRFEEFLNHSPAVIAFFYTRCDNPNKCILTIRKLADLQRLLDASQPKKIKIAAITYDSSFDYPQRLKQFTESWGLQFNNDAKAFRFVNPHEFTLLNQYLKLQVNFTGSIVNQHRIELFILDEHTRMIKSFSGLQWDPEEVAGFLKEFLRSNKPVRFFKTRALAGVHLLSTIVFAFLPKCPYCLVAYLTVFGITGVNWITIPAFQFLLIAFLLFNLIVLFYRGKRTNSYIPFILSLSGASILLLNKLLNGSAIFVYISIFLLLAASLLNAVSVTLNERLKLMGVWIRKRISGKRNMQGNKVLNIHS